MSDSEYVTRVGETFLSPRSNRLEAGPYRPTCEQLLRQYLDLHCAAADAAAEGKGAPCKCSLCQAVRELLNR